MKKSLYLIFLLLISCGPSAKEKARLQAIRDDSIRKATEEATRIQLEKKRELENAIAETKQLIEALENRLSILNTEQIVQQDRLQRIKQPQFLRTPAEREKQIREQLRGIDMINKEIQSSLRAKEAAETELRKFTEEYKMLINN